MIGTLEAARHAIHTAHAHTTPCASAPRFTNEPLLTIADAARLYRTAIRIRHHLRRAVTCTCDRTTHEHLRAQCRMFTGLCNLALRHIRNPEVFTEAIVNRSARVIDDYSVYLLTGDTQQLLRKRA